MLPEGQGRTKTTTTLTHFSLLLTFRLSLLASHDRHIMLLPPAGCDGQDSDGDGFADICEDRYPPDLVKFNAEIFRCDKYDTSRLCYNQQVFQSDLEARNFLDFQFRPTDDCQSSSNLHVDIQHTAGTCHDTLYTLTPYQDISRCENARPAGFYNITFENPLRGKDESVKKVTLQVDEEDPVVTCGFHDVDKVNVVEKDTLFYYYDKGSESTLIDSNFFYNIMVRLLGAKYPRRNQWDSLKKRAFPFLP